MRTSPDCLALPPFLTFIVAPPDGGGRAKAKGVKDDDDLDDDLDDDDEDDLDDDEDEDEDEDELDELTDEELRAELKKTREQLNRSTSSNAAKRKRLKAKEAELVELRQSKGKPAAKAKGAKGDDDPVDVEAITAAAKAEAKTEAKAVVIKAEARGALRAAGVPAERVAKAVGLLNLEDVDVDDEGEVDGLEDAVDALKKDWPELFPKGEPASKRRRVAGARDSDGRGSSPKKKPSATELQVAAALGKPIRR